MADEEPRPITASVDKETLKEALSEIIADLPAFKSLSTPGKGKDVGSSSRDTLDATDADAPSQRAGGK